MRNGGGPRLSLSKDSGLVRIDDGSRRIFVPSAVDAPKYRAGISARLASVAEKYLGNTEYQPRPGDFVVDIGAGIGEFTLWCADAGAQIVAFEPDELALECLQRNVSDLADVRILPYALWKERARLRLHGARDPNESSLIEDGKATSRQTDVEAWPLDQLPGGSELPVIDFMKMDGEGVEPEILAGGMRTLRRTRVVAIDVGATDKRPNLGAKVMSILETLAFRQLAHGRTDTILALNTAMVGPFSSPASD
jgi:FkbM family methyltransferase